MRSLYRQLTEGMDRKQKVAAAVGVGFVLLIVVAILAPARSVQSVRTVTVTERAIAAPSVTCGSGTHLSGRVCLAAVPKRTIVTRTRTVTVTTPAPAPAAVPTGASEDVGSTSHADDAAFCVKHDCIGDFEGEGGYIVECADGAYSHAGGISGSCSRHGGNA